MAGKSNDIFERIEKKYKLTRNQYDTLQDRIKDYMQADQYGVHTICNIYYDTEQFELIQRSIEKPAYKEKLRVRSYGIPSEDAPAFIEIKKKWAGVVYKRRVSLPLHEARAYLNEGTQPSAQNQIGREIDYFMDFYQPVPKMYIAYDRLAMFGKQDDSIRMTFDFNIRARDYDLDLTCGDHGELLLEEEEILMEIKVAGAYPMWMAEILSDLSIYPASFSKYGSIYKKKVTENNI